MDLGRKKRALLNFFSSFGLTIVTFATAIISSRLVIAKIGDERFGAFRSLYELFGYLSLLDGGLSITIRPLLAQSLAKNEGSDILGLLKASNVTYRFLTIISLVVGLLVTLVSDRLVPVSDAISRDLRLASVILALGLVNTCFGPKRTLCEAMQRSFLTNLLLMAQSICITVTTMILCPRIPEWGISAQAFSIVFWVTFYNIVLSAMVSRLIRTFRKSSESASRTEWNLRDLLISSRDSFVFMLTGRATMQSNSLILGYFVGQTDVTKLYATQRLYDVIQTQLYAVGNASWAAMAEIYHQGQGALFLKRMMQLIQLLLVMAISAVIPVLAFDQAFVTLWVGADRYGGDLLSWILAINAFALSFTVFSTWCLTGTGMLKAVLRMTIVTGIADVIATLLLTATMGRVGPVLGSCLVLCFLSVPWHLKLLSVHFGLSVKELARSNAKLVLFGMAYAAAVAALGQLMTVDTWAELVLVMGFPTVIFLAASALMLFDLEQRQMLLRRFGIQR